MSLKRAALDAGVRTDVFPLGAVEGGKAYRAAIDAPATVVILDTNSGLRIACEPELVGRKLEAKALETARAAAALIAKLAGYREAAFLHVLRASMGYRLHEALKEAGFRLAEAYVRVRYPEPSTGWHEGRRAEVAYLNVGSVSRERVLVLADTVATGESLVRALERFFPAAEEMGARFREVHVYGFLSEEGVRRVSLELERLGVERAFFYAMQDLTALSSNKYDMPLYGPDLAAYKSGKLKSLGGIVAEETLERMLPHYFPGMDQPGDWSERQCLLFNGGGYEEGRIVEHLERSLRMLDELYSAARSFSWFCPELEEVYRKRREGLLSAIGGGDYCLGTRSAR